MLRFTDSFAFNRIRFRRVRGEGSVCRNGWETTSGWTGRLLERHGWILLLWAFSLAAVVFVSLHPQARPPGAYGFDKFAHLLVYGWLTFLPMLTLSGRWMVLAAIVLVAFLGTALEAAQMLVPRRSAGWVGGSADQNMVGTLLGGWLGATTRIREARGRTKSCLSSHDS